MPKQSRPSELFSVAVVGLNFEHCRFWLKLLHERGTLNTKLKFAQTLG